MQQDEDRAGPFPDMDVKRMPADLLRPPGRMPGLDARGERNLGHRRSVHSVLGGIIASSITGSQANI